MAGTKKYNGSMKRASMHEMMKTQFHFRTISLDGSRMVLYHGSFEVLDLLSVYLLILFPDKRLLLSGGLSAEGRESLYEFDIGSFTDHMDSFLSFLSEYNLQRLELYS